MTPEETTDLIRRIEEAREGSREVDAEIAYGDAWRHLSEWQCAPHYTTSIDAALGLVPEGCFIEIYGDGVLAKVVPYTDKAFDDWRGFAATPALSLCAAALKAIQEMER